eukprot:TRINITY_DN12917_c0_g1_i1.p1 TRINITY_DN12917_c0_g1~~TRINITY_DN12917_c0_g1_i1.p1  ORF type:complete len:137 (-),score=29.35 TRINITY_DN12917_c0_g1_i1:35-424(-)
MYVNVRLVSAQVPSADTDGLSDPYVALQIGHEGNWHHQVKKSTVAENTLTPVWNEVIEMKVVTPMTDCVKLLVKDHDRFGGDDYLGEVIYSLAGLPAGEETMLSLSLRKGGEDVGVLNVGLTPVNFGTN